MQLVTLWTSGDVAEASTFVGLREGSLPRYTNALTTRARSAAAACLCRLGYPSG